MTQPAFRKSKSKYTFTLKDQETVTIKDTKGLELRWVGKAPYGIAAGKHTNKSYVCLDANDEQEQGKETYNIVRKISDSCEEVYQANAVMIRAMLNIPKENTVVVHPGGSYDVERKTFTFWPHDIYCTIFDEKKKPTKIDVFIKAGGIGNVVAISGVVKTYDISIFNGTMPVLDPENLLPDDETTMPGDSKSPPITHVAVTPWFNAREVIIFPADENATKAREVMLEKRKQDSVDSLMSLVTNSNVHKKRKIEYVSI